MQEGKWYRKKSINDWKRGLTVDARTIGGKIEAQILVPGDDACIPSNKGVRFRGVAAMLGNCNWVKWINKGLKYCLGKTPNE